MSAEMMELLDDLREQHAEAERDLAIERERIIELARHAGQGGGARQPSNLEQFTRLCRLEIGLAFMIVSMESH